MSVVNALSSCVSDLRVDIEKQYLSLILLFLFYITTHQSYISIDSPDMECSMSIIRQKQYDKFISGFVFWLISSVLLIIIKFLGVNTINNFVFINKQGVGTKLDTKLDDKKMDRLKWVLQTVLTVFTNLANVYYSILIIYIAYKIIEAYFNLMNCDTRNSVCDKKQIIAKLGDEVKKKCSGPNVRYISRDGKCYDDGGSDAAESVADPKDPNSSLTILSSSLSASYAPTELIDDFSPQLLKWLDFFLKPETWVAYLWITGNIVLCTSIYVWDAKDILDNFGQYKKYVVGYIIFNLLFYGFGLFNAKNGWVYGRESEIADLDSENKKLWDPWTSKDGCEKYPKGTGALNKQMMLTDYKTNCP